jgi:hypothetical protein
MINGSRIAAKPAPIFDPLTVQMILGGEWSPVHMPSEWQ